jgi:hypothetical protein
MAHLVACDGRQRLALDGDFFRAKPLPGFALRLALWRKNACRYT